MILSHYSYFPSSPDWFTIIDDFGNATRIDAEFRKIMAWQAAYRFANGQTFEQAGMRTIGCVVEEH